MQGAIFNIVTLCLEFSLCMKALRQLLVPMGPGTTLWLVLCACTHLLCASDVRMYFRQSIHTYIHTVIRLSNLFRALFFPLYSRGRDLESKYCTLCCTGEENVSQEVDFAHFVHIALTYFIFATIYRLKN